MRGCASDWRFAETEATNRLSAQRGAEGFFN